MTVFGIVMEVKPEQPENAKSPIFAARFERVIDVKFLHPSKRLLPIFVTPFGIKIEVKFEQ